ncbi:MAG: ACT domain-containing protein [Nitrososphaeria archaeon]
MSEGGLERIVITVIGKDRIGIVAGVSSLLASMGANIVDLSSTQMRDLFVMVLLAEIDPSRTPLIKLQEALNEKARELGVQVVAQHENIFKYMHRI